MLQEAMAWERPLTWSCLVCLLASAAAHTIVLFGDSLSDNGNGYAENAKFVLRTTDVRALHIFYPDFSFLQMTANLVLIYCCRIDILSYFKDQAS